MEFIEAQAERMRRSPTKAEKVLWPALRPYGFRWQFPVCLPRLKTLRNDYYILDFFHPAKNLCLEVDGSSHTRKKGRDGRRDRRLSHHGIKTIRFSNKQVLTDLENVIDIVMLELAI